MVRIYCANEDPTSSVSQPWPTFLDCDLNKEGAYVWKLGGSSGASLELTILDPESCIWVKVLADGETSAVHSGVARTGFALELEVDLEGDRVNLVTDLIPQTLRFYASLAPLMLVSIIRCFLLENSNKTGRTEREENPISRCMELTQVHLQEAPPEAGW